MVNKKPPRRNCAEFMTFYDHSPTRGDCADIKKQQLENSPVLVTAMGTDNRTWIFGTDLDKRPKKNVSKYYIIMF